MGVHAKIADTLRAVTAQRLASERAGRLVHQRLAPDFSPFAFFRLGEAELSGLIAWLLSPQGSHGQDHQFLSIFLEMTGIDAGEGDMRLARVATEYNTPFGRFDILVDATDTMVLIENKPWAADQPDQLRRYLDFLAARHHARKILIYLTPDGQSPSGFSIGEQECRDRIEAGDIRLMSYGIDILEWLDRCRGRCRADRVSTFIDEIARHIRKTFQGMADASDLDQIVDIATSSKDAIRSTLSLIAAEKEIRTQLLDMLHEQLQLKARAAGCDLKWGMHQGRYAGFHFIYDPAAECDIRFEFENANYTNLAFGLKKRKLEVGRTPELRQALVAGICEAQGTIDAGDHWPWWMNCSRQQPHCPLPADWKADPEPWAAIPDGSLANTIWAAAAAVLKVLRPDPVA